MVELDFLLNSLGNPSAQSRYFPPSAVGVDFGTMHPPRSFCLSTLTYRMAAIYFPVSLNRPVSDRYFQDTSRSSLVAVRSMLKKTCLLTIAAMVVPNWQRISEKKISMTDSTESCQVFIRVAIVSPLQKQNKYLCSRSGLGN